MPLPVLRRDKHPVGWQNGHLYVDGVIFSSVFSITIVEGQKCVYCQCKCDLHIHIQKPISELFYSFHHSFDCFIKCYWWWVRSTAAEMSYSFSLCNFFKQTDFHQHLLFFKKREGGDTSSGRHLWAIHPIKSILIIQSKVTIALSQWVLHSAQWKALSVLGNPIQVQKLAILKKMKAL